MSAASIQFLSVIDLFDRFLTSFDEDKRTGEPRYAQLSVDEGVYDNLIPGTPNTSLANPNNAARKAKSWAIGVNWYMNKMVRLMLDFDYTNFDGGAPNGGDRRSEEVMMSRVQWVF